MSSPSLSLGFNGSFDALRTTAAAVEESGCGLFVSEAAHDAFVMLTAAAEHTKTATLGMSVAIAFARTPMTMAYAAHDLQRLSGGRLVLGLGTQIAPHIVKRYGMPWSKPAARMTEYIAALHTIWDSWQTGQRLRFEGDFYTHTLMPELFSPGPLHVPLPPIWLAGVGQKMIEVAATSADGLIIHPMTSLSYRDEVMLPSIDATRAAAGRTDSFALAAMTMVATGSTEEELAASVTDTKRQIAFYASTPAYLPVLEHHGWEGLHQAAHEGMQRGEYQTLGDLVDDDVLNTFAVVGDPQQVADGLRERNQPLDQVILTMPYKGASAQAASLEILARY